MPPKRISATYPIPYEIIENIHFLMKLLETKCYFNDFLQFYPTNYRSS